MMVVSGGRDLFETHSPLVYVEVGHTVADQIIGFFESLGYHGFNEKAEDLRDTGVVRTFNLFFAKESHRDRLKQLRSFLSNRAP